jgi:hypothetical protein
LGQPKKPEASHVLLTENGISRIIVQDTLADALNIDGKGASCVWKGLPRASRHVVNPHGGVIKSPGCKVYGIWNVPPPLTTVIIAKSPSLAPAG